MMQIFLHDPDNNMIEVSVRCDRLPCFRGLLMHAMLGASMWYDVTLALPAQICNCDCLPIRPLAPCSTVLQDAQAIECPATPPAEEAGFANKRPVFANTAA